MYNQRMTPEEYVLAVLKAVNGKAFVACDIIQADKKLIHNSFYNEVMGKLNDFVLGDWKPGIKFVRT
ncbi:MAG: hypothetical protein HOO86_09975 [Bacteroidales bacterium]|nr:hypothetical protein [Bacteroidales bacterium]